MSSAYVQKSQIPPLKTYIATATANLIDVSGNVVATISAGQVLRDMGTTVYTGSFNGDILRKVEKLPVPTSGGYVTGYISLGPTAPTTGIVRLN